MDFDNICAAQHRIQDQKNIADATNTTVATPEARTTVLGSQQLSSLQAIQHEPLKGTLKHEKH